MALFQSRIVSPSVPANYTEA